MHKVLILASIIAISTGCKSMLPKKYTATHTQWEQYEELNTIANHIHAGQSIDDLKLLGIDINKTQNIEVLTHLDVAKRFGLLGLRDPNLKIPIGVQKMMDAAEKGRGYELTVENTLERRQGSFWKDFLHFKRETKITGWKFTILIITVDDTVQYVLHKGNPNINKNIIERNPLGPFQKVNGYILVDLGEELIK